MSWSVITMIGVGGALGALTRFKVRDLSKSWLGDDIHYATLLVNVTGCLLAGFLLSYWQTSTVSITLKEGVMIGFLGALTTFSTFSVEAMLLIQQQDWLKAAIYISANLLLCLLFVFVGAWLGGRIAG